MNVVRSALVAPHLYCIVSGDLLYIGETQKHPVKRWGEHLLEDGSFRRAIAIYGDPEVNYLGDIIFCSVHCVEIEQAFEPIRYRVASQAVEHEAHCLFVERQNRFKVVSDTVRTRPARFREREVARAIAVVGVRRLLEALGAKIDLLKFIGDRKW